MKNRVGICCLVVFCVLVSAALAGDRVIGPDADHVGDVKIAKGNLRIEPKSALMGNIFIEEGDLFIAEDDGCHVSLYDFRCREALHGCHVHTSTLVDL